MAEEREGEEAERLEQRYVADGEVTVELRRERKTVAIGTAQLQNVSMTGFFFVVSFPDSTSIDVTNDLVEIEVTSGPLKNLIAGGRIARLVTGPDGCSSLGVEIIDVVVEDVELLVRGMRGLKRTPSQGRRARGKKR